jgi:hypothetical protein
MKLDAEEETSLRVMKWKMNARKVIDLLKVIKPDIESKIIYETLGITKTSYNVLLRDTNNEYEKIKQKAEIEKQQLMQVQTNLPKNSYFDR